MFLGPRALLDIELRRRPAISYRYMRILFVTPRFPYPPLKGDSLRVYHELRALSKEHEITLLSIAETPPSAEDYAKIAPLCKKVCVVPLPRWEAAFNLAAGLTSRKPLQVQFYKSANFRARLKELLSSDSFDVVHAVLVRMVPYVWDICDPPVVVDLIDSQTLNLADRRTQTRGITRLAYDLEYRRMRSYERGVSRHFPALVVTSEADRRELAAPHVTVLPNGVDVARFAFSGTQGREERSLIFTGNMGYHPNEEAMLWFADQVWPLVREREPGIRLEIVGTNPGPKLRRLSSSCPGIEIIGSVPEVVPYLQKATAAVCPMRSGSGIQNKVLEAMSTGAPVIASSVANRGVHGTPGRDLLIADEPLEFAECITRVLRDADLRNSLAIAGRAYVEQHYRWEQHAKQLTDIYCALQRTAAA